MSEDTIEKTKRKMIDLFKDYEWTYQYSIFYDNPADSIHLEEDLNRLRVKIKKRDQPLYIIKRTLNRGVLQAFATIFTTRAIEGFDKLVSNSSQYEINIRKRKISDSFLVSTIQKLKKQKLHNLNIFFGRKSIKRYSVINAKKLVKRNPISCLMCVGED
jgi:hypothetical protein